MTTFLIKNTFSKTIMSLWIIGFEDEETIAEQFFEANLHLRTPIIVEYLASEYTQTTCTDYTHNHIDAHKKEMRFA